MDYSNLFVNNISLVRPMMFVFCCDLRHTICLMCFSGYCQMQMNNNKFKIFDIGYSVSCPGILVITIAADIIVKSCQFLVVVMHQ